MVTATETRKGIYGMETEAFGSDPSQIDKVYQFRYRVVGLDDVIPSHNDNLMPNPDYLTELQPRIRDRAASRTQIENIAKNLNPRALIQDSGFIDTGPMIVGSDLIVESGNGRVLALRKASQDFPEQYGKYKTMLEAMSERLGIDKEELEKIDNPVLVRERISEVDRVKFAAEANVGTVMAMSPYEQALQDAGRLSPTVVSTLAVGEEQTIDQALRMRANDHIIKHFVGNIPSTERASIADEKGTINQQGIDRLKLAIFAKTYTGDAGKRLTRIFGESADPMVKSIENAMFASLPDMAKAEGLIDAKQREADLSIAPDMAEVVDTYASLKAMGMTIKDYLAQQAMFEERLTPFQKDLLEHLDDIARKPKQVREMLRNIAGKVVDAPSKGQIGMLGLEPITKEAMVYGVVNRQRKEIGEPAFQVTTAPAQDKAFLEDYIAGKAVEDPTTIPALKEWQKGYQSARQEAEALATKPAPPAVVEAEPEKEKVKPKPKVEKVKVKVKPKPKVEKVKVKPKPEPEVKPKRKPTPAAVRRENVKVARLSIKELKRQARESEKVAKTAAPAQARTLRASAKSAKSDAERIEKAIPQMKAGKRYSITTLRAIHAARSSRSRSMDKRKQHKQVIDADSSKVERWIGKPGTADVSGIDTPSEDKVVYQKGSMKITETADKGRSQRSGKVKESRESKPYGIDLGAGVEQGRGGRRHIKL